MAKLKDSGVISCPSIPSAIIEKSVLDVSFLAGLALEKMAYHLPFYKQHQRLERSGIHLSRATLTNLIIRTSQLLEPIYGEQDEIVFLFAASRDLKVVSEALWEFTGVLITDGYKVYERYAASMPGIQHTQCWVHTRRKFFEA